MPRIVAIDYGLKRTGLAWTDPLKIIATGLETVATDQLMNRLKELVANERIEAFVLGMPYQLDGSDTHTTQPVLEFEKRLRKQFPNKAVFMQDEQFTSKMAMQSMIQAGLGKKKRRNKALVDQVSATIILQEYLASKSA